MPLSGSLTGRCEDVGATSAPIVLSRRRDDDCCSPGGTAGRSGLHGQRAAEEHPRLIALVGPVALPDPGEGVPVTRHRRCPEAVTKRRGRSSTLEVVREPCSAQEQPCQPQAPIHHQVLFASRSRWLGQAAVGDRGPGPCDRLRKQLRERRVVVTRSRPGRGAWRRRLPVGTPHRRCR